MSSVEKKRLESINDEEIKSLWYENYLREREDKGLPIEAVAVPDVDECIRQLSTEQQISDIEARKVSEERDRKEREWTEKQKSEQAKPKKVEQIKKK